MSDMRSLALTRAYELVEAGKSDEARTVLEPILLNDRDNVDAWWIYAHAVDDPAEARRALMNVIRLDRDYPGAADLLATLNEQYPEVASEPIPAPVVEAAAEELEPEFADDESYVEEPHYTPVATSVRREGSRSWLPIAVVVGIIAVLLLVLLLLLPGLNQTGVPTPTSVAALNTPQPTTVIMLPATEEATEVAVEPEITEVVLLNVTPIDLTAGDATESVELETTSMAGEAPETETAALEPVATETPTGAPAVALGVTESATQTAETQPEASPTEPAEEATLLETEAVLPTDTTDQTEAGDEEQEATAEAELAQVSYEERLATALQSFAVPEQSVEEMETEFGETVVVRVCTSEGLVLRETLRSVMALVSNEAELLPENFEGVGVRLVNCDMDRTLRIIAVDRESAVAFADDNLDEEQFEAQWRAQ